MGSNTMLGKGYLGLGFCGVALYGIMAFTGYEYLSPPRQRVPTGVRSQPGGYRSFHFWHTGYRGGK